MMLVVISRHVKFFQINGCLIGKDLSILNYLLRHVRYSSLFLTIGITKDIDLLVIPWHLIEHISHVSFKVWIEDRIKLVCINLIPRDIFHLPLVHQRKDGINGLDLLICLLVDS